MPFATVNGACLHYRVAGRSGRPPIVFANSLGSDMRIWGEVEERLRDRCEMLFFDQRGHGLSEVTEEPYSIAQLGEDLVGLLDHIGWRVVCLCGVSVGGMIAMQVADRHPDRISGLVLLDTAAKIGTVESWNERIGAVEHGGLASISEHVLFRWFPPGYAVRHPQRWAAWRRMLEGTPVQGYINTCKALRDADLQNHLARLTLPTVVRVGSADQSTPPNLVAATAQKIAGADFAIIAGAGHVPSIDAPDAVSDAIWSIGSTGRA